jgi:hypothetical protein
VIADTVLDNKLARLGISRACGGVHTARTIMLNDLRALLSHVDSVDAPNTAYRESVINANCLGKRSVRTRTLTFRHLSHLYTLHPSLLVFRTLRFIWNRDVEGQPLSAALCAYSRDAILRASAPFILGLSDGEIVNREALEDFIEAQAPGRFSNATLKSTVRNINSSWTQSGHLRGRVRKVRTRAFATPGAVSFALLLGYVSGLRGELLFKSEFTRMLDCPFDKTIELAEDASRRGWITLKRVGQVVEVVFPNLVTAQEMEWLREQN